MKELDFHFLMLMIKLVYSNILYALKGADTIGTGGSNNVVTRLILVSLTIST